ncbi:MAG: hypothetical protein QXU99_00895 [Candidatus Bathyarchaeia archaeon]
MYDAILEVLSGIFKGIILGTIAFFTVMLLSIIYRYFTNERLSSFIGIAFGLGFLGFSGGLLAILETPSIGGASEILVVTIFAVWGVNTGDKIAEKIPKKGFHAFNALKGGKSLYTLVKLPNARLIYDIASKPRVPASLKSELSEREFILPSDLPIEEVAKRVKRRLITEWGIGDVELELDQDGKVIHLAVSAKEQGLSTLIPEGKVAIPIECTVFPSNLAPGDIINVFLSNNEVLEKIEVSGVDEHRKVITVIVKEELVEKVRGKTAFLVVALPSKLSPHHAISVEQESGAIEEFKISKITESLRKVGVADDTAKSIVEKVKAKLSKIEPPISTRLIKAVLIEELEKENPEAAKKLKAHRFWR